MDLHKELVNDPRFIAAFKGVNIFGVAGTNGSGKDTVMSILADSGYLLFNTGDSLRQITKAVLGTTQRGGNDSPTGRIANIERATYPGGMVSLGLIDYWARILHIPKELQPEGLVIGSIRAVSEAEVLKKFGGKLIAVDADPKIRYKRVISRARTYESQISYEQFLAEDQAEMGDSEASAARFSTARVMKTADITLDNSDVGLDQFVKSVKAKIAAKHVNI